MKRFAFATVLAVLSALVPMHSQADSLMREFRRGSWQGILKAHAGRPTMVLFGGVTCGPCKVELPLLGAFMKEEPRLDVVVISADLVPSMRDATWTMLKNAGLDNAENWIFSDAFVERLRFEIDPAWQGEIPRTVLISRDGTLTTVEGTIGISDLRKWLDQQTAGSERPAAGERN
jgi:thiol-disulfide isomerase/thioredoxin